MQSGKENPHTNAFSWGVIFSHESIGFTLARLWPLLAFFSIGMYGSEKGTWLDFAHSVSLITLATALCVSPIVIAKLKPTLKALSITSLASYEVGTALLFAAVIFEDFALVLLLAGGLLTGLASASLDLLWGDSYSKLSASESLGSAAIAYLLSTALFFGMSQLPQVVLFLAAEACPLVSLFIIGKIQSGTQSVPSQSVSSIPPTFKKLFFGIFIFGFISGIMHKMPAVGIGEENASLPSVYLIASILDFIIILIFERFSKQFSLSNLYKLGTLIIATAVIVSPLFDWSFIVFRMGYVFFSFVVWIRLADISNKYKLPSYSVYGIGLGLLYFGLFVGDTSIYALSGLLDFNDIVTKFMISGIVTIIVLVAFYLGLNEMNLPKKNEESGHKDASAKCSELAVKYRLSKRQEEVLRLLAQGRSAKMIQECLCLSAGTVNAHVTAIYHKLDVHSRDELIKLVENFCSNNDR